MDFTLRMQPDPDERWDVTSQLAIEKVVANLPNPTGDEKPWELGPLSRMQDRFRAAGFEVSVIEERPPMGKTVLGKPGRDEEIAAVQELLRNMGELGIGVYCWVWTEYPLGVLRTDELVESRGGSLLTRYDHAVTEQQPSHEAATEITEEELWENLEYFLERVVPVAEEAGVKMALHPDDPPISPIRGVPRIVTSVEEYDRILGLYESDHHGITFCQGNFSAMGVDVPETIRHFGDDIHFVHFRDVEGTPAAFTETWHDDGPTDMVAALQAYLETGFDGPIRPDHVPVLKAELAGFDGDLHEALAEATVGNHGRLYAIGYMQGLVETLQHAEFGWQAGRTQ